MFVADWHDKVGGNYCVPRLCCASGMCPADGVRAVVRVTDASGAPVAGQRVLSTYWPLDSTIEPTAETLAETFADGGHPGRPPCVGDIMTNQNDQVYGFRSSDPSDEAGLARFHWLTPLMAETGCYRLVFYIPDSEHGATGPRAAVATDPHGKPAEHPPQTTRPQPRQWCRRTNPLNSARQMGQPGTSSSSAKQRIARGVASSRKPSLRICSTRWEARSPST